MTHTIPPAKVDGNQPEIVAALRAAGATVTHLHMVGRGCPDLVAGYLGAAWLVVMLAALRGLNPEDWE